MTKFFKHILMGFELISFAVMDIFLVVGSVFIFKCMLTSVGIKAIGLFLLFFVSIIFAILIMYFLGEILEDANELTDLKLQQSKKEM